MPSFVRFCRRIRRMMFYLQFSDHLKFYFQLVDFLYYWILFVISFMLFDTYHHPAFSCFHVPLKADCFSFVWINLLSPSNLDTYRRYLGWCMRWQVKTFLVLVHIHLMSAMVRLKLYWTTGTVNIFMALWIRLSFQ